ncbi:MAG: hypothetical protein J5747_08920 [Spirochaetaceae bacterium]|nr:hypothetical protein [Spirochaetaceae bacterium]
MIYPFMTLNDDTEIVHSEMNPEGKVKVMMETPDEKLGFKQATCILPDFDWRDINGYSDDELNYLKELVASETHLILEFSQTGGFDNASGF